MTLTLDTLKRIEQTQGAYLGWNLLGELCTQFYDPRLVSFTLLACWKDGCWHDRAGLPVKRESILINANARIGAMV
jgi:hypothetical protein